MNKNILLTIDVEDWFQVENFKPWIPYSSWDNLQLRVEKNTRTLLDIFDSFETATNFRSQGKSVKKGMKATFFILGWVAERLPELVREIDERGHEVASHGYHHALCRQLSYAELAADLKDSKKLLEDITGTEVLGYRAPSFSIDNDILKVIADSGYQYDSSYNSFERHGRYGKVSLAGYRRQGIAYRLSDSFYEIPISNKKSRINGSILPWGGGGYFRLMPGFIFNHGVNSILKKNGSYVFYIHPWEIDPSQPRVESASLSFKFRHYVNLNRTAKKLEKLIDKFSSSNFMTCKQYISSISETKTETAEDI